ncbi:hypothetical protein K6959_14925 [Bacillus aquiflavi]|uniref:hypothetical protein n=1 Tax=Bacillus aquiflavi TaxID=2672567 RepID=UPI001CA9D444|nr:hypothetical protein [Bacillus aquiflavi]UAC47879.1 hypothetical protein K6959_14925 [Bacillus aquiflavi]
MKKWLIRILLLSLVLFVFLNIYLIVKKDSKVERVVYLDQWTSVKVGDLTQTIATSGVVAPAEEHHIYFDSKLGSFKQFFVKQGEHITPGTSLYEYNEVNLEREIHRLETEKNKIDQQIMSLEEHIYHLDNYKSSLQFNEEEQGTAKTIEINIDKDILNKELEKDMLLNEAEKYEEQINALKDQSDTLIVESEVEGIVKEINVGLKKIL